MSERDELTRVRAGLTGILPRDGGPAMISAAERIGAGEVAVRPAGMPDQGPTPGTAAGPAALAGPGGAELSGRPTTAGSRHGGARRRFRPGPVRASAG